MKNEHYFNYPISLMQLLKNDDDKEGLLRIIAFGALNFSEKMRYNKTAVAKQILYLHYRKPQMLDAKIRKVLNGLIDDERIIEDEDYHGFNGASFNPESELEGLLPEFDTNSDFFYQCVEAYRESQTFQLLNLNPALRTDFRKAYQDAKTFIKNFESKNGQDAWTSVSTNILFDCFHGNLSMDYLRLISAVKSILGKRNFNVTYKSVLLCRMFGCKKTSILNDLFESKPDLSIKHAFLSRRRQWDKLLDSSLERGFFSVYSTGRQFFVSITMKEEELKKTLELRKQDYSKVKITA